MKKDFVAGPLAEVAVESGGNRRTLVFVRWLRHPPDKVWAVLTDPADLREWAPFVPDRNLAAEGAATLRMIDGDKVEELPSVVVRSDPPRLLEYSWGDDRLVWELTPQDGGTRLTLRHTVESDDWVPKVAAGWHICLVVAERLLDGRPIGPIVGAAAKGYGWEALHDAYAEKLGIAGTGWPLDKT